MDTLSVSTGQDITHGTVIGTTGNTGSSTGSHLHIECLYNGEYYNPLFYFEAGEKTLYGETPGSGSGGGGAIPPDSYNDETVQALMEEAAKSFLRVHTIQAVQSAMWEFTAETV